MIVKAMAISVAIAREVVIYYMNLFILFQSGWLAGGTVPPLVVDFQVVVSLSVALLEGMCQLVALLVGGCLQILWAVASLQVLPRLAELVGSYALNENI